MTFPDGTGYEHDLYTFSDLPSAAATYLEAKFFERSDDAAYAVLREMLEDRVDFNAVKRSAWSRFLMTLLHRTPEAVRRIRSQVNAAYPEFLEKIWESYPTNRGPHDPETFEGFLTTVTEADYQQVTLRVLQKIMDSENVGSLLNKLQWGVLRINQSDYSLLTSDRPLVLTNLLIGAKSHVAMPLSPDRIFLAADTAETMWELYVACKKANTTVRILNDRVVRQARKFVWGTDDRQLRFIKNRLGAKIRWSTFE